MSSTKTVSTGYFPRPWQRHVHALIGAYMFIVLVCHRRSGKTVLVVNELIDRALHNKKKNPQYAYLAPTFAQAKKVAWQYFIDALKDFPDVTFHQQELKITFTAPHGNGTVKIYLLGIENAENIRGMYFDGIVADEYQEWSPSVWSLIIRPALLDRKGWAIFIGTAKPNCDFKEKYDFAKTNPRWVSYELKASQSNIFTKEELDDIRAEIGDSAFEQEFECDFAGTLIGAYFSKYMVEAERSKRIGVVPYDPALSVNTYWDLGVSDTTVIWFRQQGPDGYRYIDCYFMNGVGLEHYVKVIKDKPYVYDKHVLPHDAAARDMTTGRSREEFLRGLGLRVEVQSRQSIEDRIQATRSIIPKSWFDAEKCAKGLNALKVYQRKYDAKNQVFSETPLHDWSSHFADAFGYSALDSRDQNKSNLYKDLPQQASGEYDELNY